MLKTGNLYEAVKRTEQEYIRELLSCKSQNIRIEHIVSQGHITGWYDQSENEFAAVLKGNAKLEIDGNEILELKAGEWVLIPAHVRHRVIYTSSDEACIWLAVFYEG